MDCRALAIAHSEGGMSYHCEECGAPVAEKWAPCADCAGTHEDGNADGKGAWWKRDRAKKLARVDDSVLRRDDS